MLGMFEIGQRDLPATIKLQLITLYNLVQEQHKPIDSNSNKKIKEAELLKVTIKTELLENEYKQQVLERKLEQCKIR